LKKGGKTTIYVKDTDKFNNLKHSALVAWYNTYGEYPTQAEIIEKSLQLLTNTLSSGEDKGDIKRKCEYNIV
jgi:hypothetical protein